MGLEAFADTDLAGRTGDGADDDGGIGTFGGGAYANYFYDI